MNKPRTGETATRILTDLLHEILPKYGEDPDREGLLETPNRVSKMYAELLVGYKQDSSKLFKTFESENYVGTIEVSEIDFYSLCEHHIIPFFGTVHITYAPNGKVLGLSKFARIVEMFSRRLQTQERMSKQIFDTIMDNLHPKSLTVIVKAEHLCMSMRGVEKNGAMTTTILSSIGSKSKKGANFVS